MYKILPELVINWDQTGINIVPVSQWTIEVEGAKRVEITGIDDKRDFAHDFVSSICPPFSNNKLLSCERTIPFAAALTIAEFTTPPESQSAKAPRRRRHSMSKILRRQKTSTVEPV
jgi:hypothetical protein